MHCRRNSIARLLHYLRDNRAMLHHTFITKAIASSDRIEGAVKAFAVLESFDFERQRLNATLTAQRTGLTRAAARRHLLTLAHMGYLESDGSYYWLAPKVLRLAGSYLSSARLPRAVQPTLNRLARDIGQAFSVVVLDGADAVIVARSGEHRNASRIMPMGIHLGARLPAFATSTGRVLLAGLDAAGLSQRLNSVKPYALTPHTLTQKTAIRTEVRKVQKQGFCYVAEEHELDLHALAVPLRDTTGRVMAALNLVQNPMLHKAEDFQRRYLPVLLQAEAEIRGLL